MSAYVDGATATYSYYPNGLRAAKTAGGTTTEFVLDGGNVVLETVGGAVTAKYIRAMNLIASTIGGTMSYYLYNAHGDVVQLTNASGTVTKAYDYDAFGVEQNPDTNDTNPWRYCGEYWDKETGTYYLRARYYAPGTGRFTQEDPAGAGLNWYTYCAGSPIAFIDPTGLAQVALRAFLENYGGTVGWNSGTNIASGKINGISKSYSSRDNRITNIDGRLWIDDSILIRDFDLKNSGTYNIINDLGTRWNSTSDTAERDRLHNIANDVRAMERAGTPYMYGQDKVMSALHSNAAEGQKIVDATATMAKYGYSGSRLGAYSWYVTSTCNNWNYKLDPNWQVPYSRFNGLDMSANNNKNWQPWIYFEGKVWGADKIGNINLGYVGTKMGFDGVMIQNALTMDKDDGPSVTLGIQLANAGR